jgi:hypothetical protein
LVLTSVFVLKDRLHWRNFLAKLSAILCHCLIALAQLGLHDRGRITTQGGQGKYIVFCLSSDTVMALSRQTSLMEIQLYGLFTLVKFVSETIGDSDK